jgi:hypothetical protein
MQLPIQLPTDNLYKFAALIGFTLFIVALSIPPFLAYKVDKNLPSDLASVKKLQLEDRVLKNKIKHIEDAEKRINTEIKTLVNKQISKYTNTVKALSDLDLKRISAHHRRAEIRILVKEQADTLIHHTKYSNLIDIIMIIVAPLGALLAAIGFYFWYTRIQVLLDKKLLNESINKLE